MTVPQTWVDLQDARENLFRCSYVRNPCQSLVLGKNTPSCTFNIITSYNVTTMHNNSSPTRY